jgi:acetyltransferase-like isoleucine patch superfamily enzyme
MSLRSFVGSRMGNAELVLAAVASRVPVHRLRVGIIKALGARIDDTATLYHGFQIRAGRRLTIGARTNIGDGAILDARGGLTIGEDVNFSTQVHVWTAQHGWDDPDFAYESAPVVIGHHVWLSTRVTVLPGVTIGDGAVVAAGAVVTKDLAPYALYGGVPARFIRARESPKEYRLAASAAKSWWW